MSADLPQATSNEVPTPVTAITVTNADGDQAAPPSPERPGGGGRYRFEMLHAGNSRRTYADTTDALVAVLIEGYQQMPDAERWAARLNLATRVQVVTQAHLNTADGFRWCTSHQQRLLTGPRYEPPVVAEWDCPIPLVLIATFYAPAGTCPTPEPRAGMAPNIVWLDPSDDGTLLRSLHDVGFVTVHEATEPSA